MLSQKLFNVLQQKQIPCEFNIKSMHHKSDFKQEFWKMRPKGVPMIVGLDAHSVQQMKEYYLLSKVMK